MWPDGQGGVRGVEVAGGIEKLWFGHLKAGFRFSRKYSWQLLRTLRLMGGQQLTDKEFLRMAVTNSLEMLKMMLGGSREVKLDLEKNLGYKAKEIFAREMIEGDTIDPEKLIMLKLEYLSWFARLDFLGMDPDQMIHNNTAEL